MRNHRDTDSALTPARRAGSALGRGSDGGGSEGGRRARGSILLSSVAPGVGVRGVARSRLLTLVATPAALHAELVAPTEVPVFRRSTYVAGDRSAAGASSPSPSSALRFKKEAPGSDASSERSWLGAGHEAHLCASPGTSASPSVCSSDGHMPVRVSQRTFEAQRMGSGAGAGAGEQPFAGGGGAAVSLLRSLPSDGETRSRPRALRRNALQLDLRSGVQLHGDAWHSAASDGRISVASSETDRASPAPRSPTPQRRQLVGEHAAGSGRVATAAEHSNMHGSPSRHNSRAVAAASAAAGRFLLRRNVSQLEQVCGRDLQSDGTDAAVEAPDVRMQSQPSLSQASRAHQQRRSSRNGELCRKPEGRASAERGSDNDPHVDRAAHAQASKLLQRSVPQLQRLCGDAVQLTPEAAPEPPPPQPPRPLVAGPTADLQRSVSQLEQRLRASRRDRGGASAGPSDGKFSLLGPSRNLPGVSAAAAPQDTLPEHLGAALHPQRLSTRQSLGGGAVGHVHSGEQPSGAWADESGTRASAAARSGPVRLVSRAGRELQAARRRSDA